MKSIRSPGRRAPFGLTPQCADPDVLATIEAVGRLVAVYQAVLPGRWRARQALLPPDATDDDTCRWPLSLAYPAVVALARLLIADLRAAGLPLVGEAILDEADAMADDGYPYYALAIPVGAALTWVERADSPPPLLRLLTGIVTRWASDLACPAHRARFATETGRSAALAAILAADAAVTGQDAAPRRRHTAVPTPAVAVIEDQAGAFARLGDDLADIPDLAAYLVGETGNALLDRPQGAWFEWWEVDALRWHPDNVRDLLLLAAEAREDLARYNRIIAALGERAALGPVLDALATTLALCVGKEGRHARARANDRHRAAARRTPATRRAAGPSA